MLSAGLENIPGTVDIYPHAEVEVFLGVGAYHSGEVKHPVGLRPDELPRKRGVRDVTRVDPDPLVFREILRFGNVEKRQRLDFVLPPVGADQVTALQEGFGKLLADKPCRAGNDEVH